MLTAPAASYTYSCGGPASVQAVCTVAVIVSYETPMAIGPLVGTTEAIDEF